MKYVYVPTNQNLSDDTVPHISSALGDLHLGDILLLFLWVTIQKYTVENWYRHYYTIWNKLFG